MRQKPPLLFCSGKAERNKKNPNFKVLVRKKKNQIKKFSWSGVITRCGDDVCIVRNRKSQTPRKLSKGKSLVKGRSFFKSECSFFARLKDLNPLLSLSIISEMARVLRVARSSSLFSFGSRSYSAEASHVSSPSPFLGARRDVTKERNVQWVFLGCPGVGKGTYASRLSSLLGVPHIATGDLVRDALASSGPLSQQVLVSLYVQMNPKTTSF